MVPAIVPAIVDHLIVGCHDLESGIAAIEAATGIRAASGGVHPGRGTRNALLSMGTGQYLEIIAPDPAQPTITWFTAIRGMTAPQLIGWAAAAVGIDAVARRFRDARIACTGPTRGSRARPDGTLLAWQTVVLDDDAGGVLPFFIEWSSDSVHPSVDSPDGCALARFDAVSPDVAQLTRRAQALGVDLSIEYATRQRLRASIVGPRGSIDLSSLA
jgi:Glyoxalase-like domain